MLLLLMQGAPYLLALANFYILERERLQVSIVQIGHRSAHRKGPLIFKQTNMDHTNICLVRFGSRSVLFTTSITTTV